MGSGTTAVAARRCGRNFVGFELNAEYCELIEARLKSMEKQAAA
jgi:site-specific DNA-methyltransferase (adenine-specific)